MMKKLSLIAILAMALTAAVSCDDDSSDSSKHEEQQQGGQGGQQGTKSAADTFKDVVLDCTDSTKSSNSFSASSEDKEKFKEIIALNAADHPLCKEKYDAFYTCAAKQSCDYLADVFWYMTKDEEDSREEPSYAECAVNKRDLDACISEKYPEGGAGSETTMQKYVEKVDSCVEEYNDANPNDQISEARLQDWSAEKESLLSGNDEMPLCKDKTDQLYSCMTDLDCETLINWEMDIHEEVDFKTCSSAAETYDSCIIDNYCEECQE